VIEVAVKHLGVDGAQQRALITGREHLGGEEPRP